MSRDADHKVVTGEASESESDEEVSTDEKDLLPERPAKTDTDHLENTDPGMKTTSEVTEMKAVAEVETDSKVHDVKAEGQMRSQEVQREGSSADKHATNDSLNVATPLKIDLNGEGDSLPVDNTPMSPTTPDPLKYHTLLHKKLRERNVALHSHMKKFVAQEYSSCTQSLHQISQQMNKSQAAMQDISSCLQMLTNDLFHLEDKVSIITDYHILPLFNFDQFTPPSTPP